MSYFKDVIKNKKQKVIIVCGPTASGKSDLAVRIAKKFNGEIISADSRQVYRGMNIGTGKITKKEMAGVPHFMLDVVSPKNRFTVVEYVKRAQKNLKEIFLRGHTPIVCGGTGFYISALVDGIVFPDVPPNLKLREKLAKLSGEKLIAILKKLDPKRAESIDQKNLRRVIRAIEIATTLGKVPKLEISQNQNYDCLFIGTKIDSEKLRQKIHIRLLSRIKDGMIKEAKDLHKKGLSWKRMEELGLEYRYLAQFLQNKITKEKMLSELETEIWHYARRQMTWFKRDKKIVWVSPNKIGDINKLVKNFLS